VALSDILRRRTILVSKAEMASSRHATKFMGTRPNDLGFPSCGKSDSRLILGIGQKRAFALDVPGIRVLTQQERRGWPGHRRAKATPFFGRLCPAMTKNESFEVVWRVLKMLAAP
jgi:hypothetical protein